jgi:hypothetical protein
MSMGRRNLSCFKEQLKPFFSMGNNHVPKEKEFKLLLRSNLSLFFFSMGNNCVPRQKEFFKNMVVFRGSIFFLKIPSKI